MKIKLGLDLASKISPETFDLGQISKSDGIVTATYNLEKQWK